MKENKVILVDASSYFLSFSYQDSKQMNNDMIKLINSVNFHYGYDDILFVFEGNPPLYKNELFPSYKLNRNKSSMIFKKEINDVFEKLNEVKCSVFFKSGIEAQDAIGTISNLATQKMKDVIIVSKSFDMAQLINDNIILVDIDTLNNVTTYCKKDIFNKYKISPSQIPDYLAIAGKKVDGIPGVIGIGSKTAISLIQEFKSLQGVYENIDKINTVLKKRSLSIMKKLTENSSNAHLSHYLSTINKDLSFDFSFDDILNCKRNSLPLNITVNKNKNKNVVELSTKKEKEAPLFSIINSVPLILDMIEEINKENQFSLFVQLNPENKNHPYRASDILGLSISVKNNNFYLPLINKDALSVEATLEYLKPILENENIKIVGFNLKSEFSFFYQHGINLINTISTQIEAFVLFPNVKNTLSDLSLELIGFDILSDKKITQKGKLINDLNLIGQISSEKSSAILMLHQYFSSLEKFDSVESVINEIDNPLCEVIGHMEYQGVLVDSLMLSLQDNRLTKLQNSIESKVFSTIGYQFNIDSNVQRKNAILSYTEDDKDLLLDNIKEYRSISTLKSKYLNTLPKNVNIATGKIHTNYSQTTAKTGRLSSKNPNLQSIPVKSLEGRKIREAFIAEKGFKIVSLDYSQIELRILAHLSQDVLLIHAFNSGVDIHKKTASEIFDVCIEDVSDEMRRVAKSINFGIIYGKTAFGLSLELDISYMKAKLYIESYFKKYHGVKRYIDITKSEVKKNGYISTISNRRLYYPLIHSTNSGEVKAAERQAINAIMQGSASDLIKKAMINVFDWIQTKDKDVLMLMQVHDELIFKIKDKVAEKYALKIANIMETAIVLSIPLVADIGIGDNWSEAH